MNEEDIETELKIQEKLVKIRSYAFEGNDNLVMYTGRQQMTLQYAKHNPKELGEKIIEIHENMEDELDK